MPSHRSAANPPVARVVPDWYLRSRLKMRQIMLLVAAPVLVPRAVARFKSRHRNHTVLIREATAAGLLPAPRYDWRAHGRFLENPHAAKHALLKPEQGRQMKPAKLLVLLTAAAPCAAWAQVETYSIDPYHTIPHFFLEYHGFGTIPGRFDKASGKFSIDRAARKGTLEFSIETASVNTGDADRGKRPRSRDEHLRGADFFNSAEFPRMTFKSANVRFNGDTPAEVEGQISLLGVTRPLTLRIERWLCKEHAIYKRPTCGGNASGTLKRSDFGMKYGLPSVGDEIRLTTLFLGFRD